VERVSGISHSSKRKRRKLRVHSHPLRDWDKTVEQKIIGVLKEGKRMRRRTHHLSLCGMPSSPEGIRRREEEDWGKTSRTRGCLTNHGPLRIIQRERAKVECRKKISLATASPRARESFLSLHLEECLGGAKTKSRTTEQRGRIVKRRGLGEGGGRQMMHYSV